MRFRLVDGGFVDVNASREMVLKNLQGFQGDGITVGDSVLVYREGIIFMRNVTVIEEVGE